MATTINNKRASCGRTVVGTWSRAADDAFNSIAIQGYVWGGQILSVDDDDMIDLSKHIAISRSTTTGISTITFRYGGEVTDGRFWFYVTSN